MYSCCPVSPEDRTGVVNPAMAGSPSLTLNKLKRFETGLYNNEFVKSRIHQQTTTQWGIAWQKLTLAV